MVKVVIIEAEKMGTKNNRRIKVNEGVTIYRSGITATKQE